MSWGKVDHVAISMMTMPIGGNIMCYQIIHLRPNHPMRELEEENSKLKHMYAELSLDHKLLKEIVQKKL